MDQLHTFVKKKRDSDSTYRDHARKKGSHHGRKHREKSQNQERISRISKYKTRAIHRSNQLYQEEFQGFKNTYIPKQIDNLIIIKLLIAFFIIVYLLLTNIIKNAQDSVSSDQWLAYIYLSIPTLCIMVALFIFRRVRKNHLIKNVNKKQQMEILLPKRINKKFSLDKYLNDIYAVVLSTTVLVLTFLTSVRRNNYFFTDGKYSTFFATSILWCVYVAVWSIITRYTLKCIIMFIHYIVLLALIFNDTEFDSSAFQVYKVLFLIIFEMVILFLFARNHELQLKNCFEIFKNQNKIDENWKIMVQQMPLGVIIVSYHNEMLFINKSASETLNVLQPSSNSHINMYVQKFQELVQKLGRLEEFEKKEVEKKLLAQNSKSSSSQNIINKNGSPDKAEQNNKLNSNINILNQQQKQDQQNNVIHKGYVSLEHTLSTMKLDDVYDINDQQYKLTKYFYSSLNKPNLIEEQQLEQNASSNEFGFNENLNDEGGEDNANPQASTYKEIELQISNHFKFNGQKTFMVILEDVTSSKMLQNLSEDHQTKKKVLMSFSNLLRTPLNGAIPPIESCLADSRIPKDCKDGQLMHSMNSLMLLQHMVDDIVDYALMISDQLYLKIDDFNIRKLAHTIINLFKTQAEQKKIKLILKIQKEIPVNIKTDSRRLTQIIINLMQNALKYTQRGQITLIMRLQNEKKKIVSFGVQDTGIGMDQPTINLLQEHFLKPELEDGKHITQTGVGLGLQISHSLAKWLGPENSKMSGLQVVSQLNAGSYFGFFIQNHDQGDGEKLGQMINMQNKKPGIAQNDYSSNSSNESHDSEQDMKMMEDRIRSDLLQFDINDVHPLSEDQSEESPVDNPQTSIEINQANHVNLTQQQKGEQRPSNEFASAEIKIHQCLNCFDIMSVDDDAFNQLSLEGLLKKFNLTVKKAFNGQEAIDMILDFYTNSKKRCQLGCRGFQLIFMDYNMPILDGCQAARILRQMMEDKRIPELPIVAITAHGAYEDYQKCIDSGMLECMTKPISFDMISQIVKKYVTNAQFSYSNVESTNSKNQL